MLKKIFSLKNMRKNYKIQSFTFFIPSPPPKAQGHREKQFDRVFYAFINKGYRILDFKTVPSSGEKQSGMWLIFILQAQNEAADLLDLDDFFLETTKNNEIDGLYYIDEKDEIR